MTSFLLPVLLLPGSALLPHRSLIPPKTRKNRRPRQARTLARPERLLTTITQQDMLALRIEIASGPHGHYWNNQPIPHTRSSFPWYIVKQQKLFHAEKLSPLTSNLPSLRFIPGKRRLVSLIARQLVDNLFEYPVQIDIVQHLLSDQTILNQFLFIEPDPDFPLGILRIIGTVDKIAHRPLIQT